MTPPWRRSWVAATTAIVFVACAACTGGDDTTSPSEPPVGPATSDGNPGSTPGRATPEGRTSPNGTRDPLRWPYPWDSIWNHPLGDEAELVDFEMTIPTDRTMNAEEDIIVAHPEAPPVPVYRHEASWRDDVRRCEARTGDVIADGLPIPDGWTTEPDYHGNKPNHAGAIVLPDMTLWETQPLHRCEDGTVVSQYHNDRWEGDSILTGGHADPQHGGSHGGSYMTAFGGTIRLGEWVPGGSIPHALKMVVYSPENLSPADGGYRWPALEADREYQAKYGGHVSAARMGALLALPPDFDVDALQTEPARILANTLQRYGAYIVDGSGWSTAAFATEWGPDGRVKDEFEQEWGYSFVGHVDDAEGEQREFLEDVEALYAELHVVDDNAPDNIGGAGDRLAPWAPPFHDGTGGHPSDTAHTAPADGGRGRPEHATDSATGDRPGDAADDATGDRGRDGGDGDE